MFFKQYFLGCLAQASYLIADERTKIAAVIDPLRDVDQYLQEAAAHGWRIEYVFLTHFHADFLAGHIELRERTGAKIHLGAKAQAEYAFTPLHDGDAIEFGDVRLQVLETPGHTPEGISLLVYDLAKDRANPHAVLTGDTLFVGDVGRPDLLASIGVTANELANMLYESVNRLKQLPDATLVYPGHGAGSLCGRSLSKETVSTIGEQKQFNYALQPMSRDEFVRLVEEDQPEAPGYFAYDAMLNRQEHASLETSMQETVRPLELTDVLRRQQAGAQVLDVREALEFDGVHLAGAINIGLKGKYATWCGTILNRDQEIIVVADPGDEREAIVRLGRIGFDHVAGYLQGGMQSLETHPELVTTTQRITPQALADQMAGEHPPAVLDVRTDKERESSGFIAESLHIPLNELPRRLAEVRADRPLAVHCEGGYRSAIACSLLQQRGLSPLDLSGGFKAWQASKLPTVEAASV